MRMPRIYKERTKAWHDKHIMRKDFQLGQQVLLFNSKLKLFLGKLKSRWSGPFVITQVFSYGCVELSNLEKGNFKVNGKKIEAVFWWRSRQVQRNHHFESTMRNLLEV